MAEALSIFRTYNARVEAGVVKRGRVLDDWLRYGLYYGTPEYLHVHDFSNWNILVFDYDVLAQGVDPVDYAGTDIYLYIAFGGRFSRAARTGGYNPPSGNVDELLVLREEVHREIDAILDAGFAGIFWDECDTGFWDWSYSVESSNILRDQLQEYCDYIRGRGGKNFINGTPWFAECGESFMLESFMATWAHNLFAPDYTQNNFFTKYLFSLDEAGEAGGIPWTTGIYAWLYAQKYAPDTDIFAHSYGKPESIWHLDKQKFSLASALALGLKSWNFIEPTNQVLIDLYAHSFYVGAPLECPQVNLVNKIATRKYTGAQVSFNERSGVGEINMNVEPDYWWNFNQEFNDIDFEGDGAKLLGEGQTSDFVPDYLKIDEIYMYDDRKEVYFRFRMEGIFEETDIIPFYVYMNLDPNLDGFHQARSDIDNSPYLYFRDLNAQVYLFGKSLFYWKDNSWKYLYSIKYFLEDNYAYFSVRKESLRFAVPSWDEVHIRLLPLFMYESGSNHFTNYDYATKPSCLPSITARPFKVQYKYIQWYTYDPEGFINEGDDENGECDHGECLWEESYRPFPSCKVPVLIKDDPVATSDLEFNQIKLEEPKIRYLHLFSHSRDIDELDWWSLDPTDVLEVIIDKYVNWYTCIFGFTIYGHVRCECTFQDDVYSPHSAVIYSTDGQINKRVSQVSITGNFSKAWVFDRQNGQFVGPDDTPDTYYTSSPFSPTKIIDGQDIFVVIANDETSSTLDTWSVSAVDVTLVNWASTHDQGYDIPLPDLLEWQSVYEEWKGAIMAETVENEYLPAGIQRGGINVKKDSIKGSFTVSVPSSGAIVTALETYDITNAALVMRRTYEDLDHTDPDNTDLIVWAYVDSWELSDTELRIRAKLNFHNWGATFPKRRASYFCPFVFRGPACGYGGATLECNKTLPECVGMGNDSNFGGIPTLPRLMRGKWR